MQNREAWEAPVAQMVADYGTSAKNARRTLGFFAQLLRADALPQSGREFLADKLAAIAGGRSPGTLLPRRRKKRKDTALHIMAAVERQREKTSAGRGDMREVYRRVARAHGIPTWQSCQSRASEGRRRLRLSFEREVAAGVDAQDVVAALSKLLKLPPLIVRKLTTRNRLDV